jgi:hypothetical protein
MIFFPFFAKVVWVLRGWILQKRKAQAEQTKRVIISKNRLGRLLKRRKL